MHQLSTNNKTSLLVSSELPQFVREDHETFVTFLEEYYKFLEQEGGLMEVTKNFYHYLDPDVARGDNDIVLNKLYDNFIALIPSEVIADKNLIMKHAKDFYRSAGSEKSVRFLLRILFNKEVDFYYPKNDVLRASDGKWFIEKSIKIKDVALANVPDASGLSAFKFANTQIRGVRTNATATVEKVEPYIINGVNIIELRLSAITRDFSNGEEIFSYITDNGVDKYLSANLYSGLVVGANIYYGGTGYKERTYVPIEDQNDPGDTPGSGAVGIIKRATADEISGNIVSVIVIEQGAGFRVNDEILFVDQGIPLAAITATAEVFEVETDESHHPNTYNIYSQVISSEEQTIIGNTLYANLSTTVTDPANAWISNTLSAWSYSNTGPVRQVIITNEGSKYKKIPTASILGNTSIRSLGIIGKVNINNGGENYVVGDEIEFINPYGTFGVGARANVTEVHPTTGAIIEIRLQPCYSGSNIVYQAGGQGYSQINLPTCNVRSDTGTNAEIQPVTTLGYGEYIIATSDNIGSILEIKILAGGSGYLNPPKINLTSFGDGTAMANAEIVTGFYTYPGRYLNDDGQLSAFNFLEDRDYYQNFSYVLRTDVPLRDYEPAIKSLTHAAGTKLFGEYLFTDDSLAIDANVNTQVHIEATTDRITNVSSYVVKPIGETVVLSSNVTNLTVNTGSGASVTTINLNSWAQNSNVYFSNGYYLNVGTNSVKVISTIGKSNTVIVSPGLPGNIVANVVTVARIANSVNVTISKTSHGFKAGNNVILNFKSSDNYPSLNLSNGLYRVTGVATDSFFITMGNTSNGKAYTNGNVYVTFAY